MTKNISVVDTSNFKRQKIRLNLPAGERLSSVFKAISEQTGAPVVGFIPNDHLTLAKPIALQAPLAEMCNVIADSHGMAWGISGRYILFTHGPTSEARAKLMKQVLAVWKSLGSEERSSLLRGQVLQLETLSEPVKSQLLDLLGEEALALPNHWRGLSLTYDLNVFFGETTSNGNPQRGLAVATPVVTIGQPNGAIKSTNRLKSGALVYTSNEQNALQPPTTFGEFNTLAPLSKGMKLKLKETQSFDLDAGEWELSSLAAELTARSGQPIHFENNWKRQTLWLPQIEGATVAEVLGLIGEATQLKITEVDNQWFFKPDTQNFVPIEQQLDDMAWLSHQLAPLITEKELEKLQGLFPTANWVQCAQTSVDKLNTEQRNWLQRATNDLPSSFINWKQKFGNGIEQKPETVTVRFVPRFSFRLGHYYRSADETDLNIASKVAYHRLDAYRWNMPVRPASFENRTNFKDTYISTTEFASALQKAVLSPDAQVRKEVVFAIEASSLRQYAPLLDALSLDSEEETRLNALRVLKRFGFDEYEPRLRANLKSYSEKSELHKLDAARNSRDASLVELGRTNLNATAPELRSSALLLLGVLKDNASSANLQELTEKDAIAEVRAAARGGLFLLKEKHRSNDVLKLQPLETSLTPPEQMAVLKAIALAQIERGQYTTANPLLWNIINQSLLSDDTNVRVWAMRGAAQIGVGTMIPKLLKLSNSTDLREKIAAMAAIIAIQQDQGYQGYLGSSTSIQANMANSLAWDLVEQSKHGFILPEHFLLSLLELPDSNAYKILVKKGVDVTQFKADLVELMKNESFETYLNATRQKDANITQRLGDKWWESGHVLGSMEMNTVSIQYALPFQQRKGYDVATTDGFLYGIASLPNGFGQKLLLKYGLTPEAITTLSEGLTTEDMNIAPA
jgi:HEAT repeat protein